MQDYSAEWKPGDEHGSSECGSLEPYYPVNDAKNQTLYEKYSQLADREHKVIFGGRLAEYKYYDMDKVIRRALDASERFMDKK